MTSGGHEPADPTFLPKSPFREMSDMALHPGHHLYDQAMASLFNGDAAATDPLVIVQPRHEEDVVAAVQQARRDVFH